MNITKKLNVSMNDIVTFCNRNHIKKLAVFGSALGGELKQESDIDILVEFNEEYIPSFLKLFDMEEELSTLFNGLKVDLRTPKELSRYFRSEVMENAEVLHVEA